MGANNEPKQTGIAEFSDTQGVFTCLKFLDGLKLTVYNKASDSESTSSLLVKSNTKTVAYFQEIKDLKRQEYMEFVKNKVQDSEEVPKEQELIETE